MDIKLDKATLIIAGVGMLLALICPCILCCMIMRILL